MTYKELYEKAAAMLDRGKITLGDFNKMVKPLDVEIQPEPHEIGYDDCANALLKMWMDNVLTDGEYYRIAGKLNVKWGKTELPEPYKGVTE